MYDNLKECVQGRQLVNSLDNDALDIIESVLEAHNQGKIDFKIIDNNKKMKNIALWGKAR